MGAYRDRETFALHDANRYGQESGRRYALEEVASDLGVSTEIIDRLGSDINVASRTERLRAIAESVGAMLVDAENELEILQNSSPGDVAGYFINTQVVVDSEENNAMYHDSISRYRFANSDDGEVVVETKVHGGSMLGPIKFNDTVPLTATWVGERLAEKGAPREAEFCVLVVEGINTQFTETLGAQNG